MSPVQRRLEVSGIPAVVVEPENPPSRLVVWLTHLGGSKGRALPQLRSLAAGGCRAVSFDPPGHGDRATGSDARAYAEAVLERFRRRMWPILGQATLEALRVIDATRDPAITSIGTGGISMGGISRSPWPGSPRGSTASPPSARRVIGHDPA